MNNNMLTDHTNVFYVVKVNGQEMSRRCATLWQAEQALSQLAESMQPTATIAVVDSAGRQVLLG